MEENCTFTIFDIVEFYPSISEDLLNSALSFAKRHVKIPVKKWTSYNTLEGPLCSATTKHR